MRKDCASWWLTFFEELEKEIPPVGSRHHALLRTQYGSDDEGWQAKLTLQIGTQTFFIDEEDLDKPAPDLVREIKELMEKIDEGQ